FCDLSPLNVGNCESLSSSVVRVMGNIDVVAMNGVSDCEKYIKSNLNRSETKLFNAVDNMAVVPHTNKLALSKSDTDSENLVHADTHKEMVCASAKGASGSCSGPPAPLPAPLPPGYSGTMGCLDAHYPRCLMGHYL
ncbi:hypothetical protein SK128_012161, partial [Halocaridina rubra]